MVPFEADPSGITDILGIPIGQLTINGLALLVIGSILFAFIKGGLVSKATLERELEQANKRAEDYKEALAISEKRGDVLEQIGVSVTKLLDAIPRPDGPPRGGTSP